SGPDSRSPQLPVASGRVAGVPSAGGWAAVDGDPDTAWVTPFAYPHGVSLDIPLPDRRAIDAFTITQPDADFSRITALRVTAGDASFTVPVPDPDQHGSSEVSLPEPVRAPRGAAGEQASAATIRLTVEEIADEPPFIDRLYAE